MYQFGPGQLFLSTLPFQSAFKPVKVWNTAFTDTVMVYIFQLLIYRDSVRFHYSLQLRVWVFLVENAFIITVVNITHNAVQPPATTNGAVGFTPCFITN